MLYNIFSAVVLVFVGFCFAQVAIILWENRT